MKKTLEQRVGDAVSEPIVIVPYDLSWPLRFEKEASHLRRILPKNMVGRIEHFGSTAIPGLSAKPIIDMLVEVQSLVETQKRIVPILENKDYDYFWRTDVSPPYAWFIKRNAEGHRTHHLHLVEPESSMWARLLFRDYLRRFPDEAKRYCELKLRLAAEHPLDRIAYTKGKTDYVERITKRAARFFRPKELT